jgi:hypothetical protein
MRLASLLNACGRWKVTNLVQMGQGQLVVLSVPPMHSMVNPRAFFNANFAIYLPSSLP